MTSPQLVAPIRCSQFVCGTAFFMMAMLWFCRCSRGSESAKFHVAPWMAGAFPGTPVFGTDLCHGEVNLERMWFNLDYLEDLHILRKNSPRVAVNALVATLFERHQESCGSTLSSQETVAKQLHKTLEEYENVKFLEAKALNDIAEGAEGGLACQCPACFQTTETLGKHTLASKMHLCCSPWMAAYCCGYAGLSIVSTDLYQVQWTIRIRAGSGSGEKTVYRMQIYLDGNFRVPHLTDAGAATLHEPPIQDKFFPDASVKRFCSERDNSVQPTDVNTCNNFDADKQLVRTKAKYDITGGVMILPGRFGKHRHNKVVSLSCWISGQYCTK